jgi:hypothetical protein
VEQDGKKITLELQMDGEATRAAEHPAIQRLLGYNPSGIPCRAGSADWRKLVGTSIKTSRMQKVLPLPATDA